MKCNYVCMYIRTYVCMSVCINRCMHACMFVWYVRYVCVCMYLSNARSSMPGTAMKDPGSSQGAERRGQGQPGAARVPGSRPSAARKQARSSQGAARSSQGAARSSQGAAKGSQEQPGTSQGAARSTICGSKGLQEGALRDLEVAKMLKHRWLPSHLRLQGEALQDHIATKC